MSKRPIDDLDNDYSHEDQSEDKQRSFFFFATIALAAVISIFGIAGGFIYGDYYGRKHAQYENPELRKYYAGQCFSYVDGQLKKTIKTSFEKQARSAEQGERLEDIRNILVSMQMDLQNLGNGKKIKNKDLSMKKKVASAAQ